MQPSDLSSRKRRLSPKLLALGAVSGVGLGSGELVVYLVSDSEEAREQVRALVEAEEPGTPLTFEVTGEFRKS